MTKIHLPSDCGNSPRKLFLANFVTILAHGDKDELAAIIPPEITWQLVGQKQANEKEEYLAEVLNHPIWNADVITIDTMITHGPDASVSGQIIAKDGQCFAFSDIYRFKGAGGMTLKSVASFVITL